MKRHVPEYTAHGEAEECVVCKARRPRRILYYPGTQLYRFERGPWRLKGRPAPLCPGKKEEKA